jgi:short-subunit dehydrogenase
VAADVGARAALGAPVHILITGASSGIGAALARCYAREGMRLSLVARNEERLGQVALECRKAGARSEWKTIDVVQSEAMRAWIEECDGQQPVDMVIANAGIGGDKVIAPAAGEPLPVAREIVETNILGVTNSVVPLLPRFVARGRGHVVIMSSLAALVGLPDAPLYSASKAAVRVYGHGLRRLLEPKGIRVTVVCPGFVATPMSASVPGHPPFLWSAERAAARIVTGLGRGKREISFPWQLAALTRFAAALPPSLIDPLLQRTRRGRT